MKNMFYLGSKIVVYSFLEDEDIGSVSIEDLVITENGEDITESYGEAKANIRSKLMEWEAAEVTNGDRAQLYRDLKKLTNQA